MVYFSPLTFFRRFRFVAAICNLFFSEWFKHGYHQLFPFVQRAFFIVRFVQLHYSKWFPELQQMRSTEREIHFWKVSKWSCALVSVCIFKENNWDGVVTEDPIAVKFVANIKCLKCFPSTPMKNHCETNYWNAAGDWISHIENKRKTREKTSQTEYRGPTIRTKLQREFIFLSSVEGEVEIQESHIITKHKIFSFFRHFVPIH